MSLEVPNLKKNLKYIVLVLVIVIIGLFIGVKYLYKQEVAPEQQAPQPQVTTVYPLTIKVLWDYLNGTMEPIEGATVTLKTQSGKVIGSATTLSTGECQFLDESFKNFASFRVYIKADKTIYETTITLDTLVEQGGSKYYYKKVSIVKVFDSLNITVTDPERNKLNEGDVYNVTVTQVTQPQFSLYLDNPYLGTGFRSFTEAGTGRTLQLVILMTVETVSGSDTVNVASEGWTPVVTYSATKIIYAHTITDEQALDSYIREGARRIGSYALNIIYDATGLVQGDKVKITITVYAYLDLEYYKTYKRPNVEAFQVASFYFYIAG